MTALVVHAAHPLESLVPNDAVPLCWHAELLGRGHAGADDEGWLLSLDIDAIRESDDAEPGSFVLSRDQARPVSCSECLEWVHA